jgi:hypothetical protein
MLDPRRRFKHTPRGVSTLVDTPRRAGASVRAAMTPTLSSARESVASGERPAAAAHPLRAAGHPRLDLVRSEDVFMIDIGLAGAFVERAESLPWTRARDPRALAGLRDPIQRLLPRGLVAPGGGAALLQVAAARGRGCSSSGCRTRTASGCARCSWTTAGRTPACAGSSATGPRRSARATTRRPADAGGARPRRPRAAGDLRQRGRLRPGGAQHRRRRARPRGPRGLAHRGVLADGLGRARGARGGPRVRRTCAPPSRGRR